MMSVILDENKMSKVLYCTIYNLYKSVPADIGKDSRYRNVLCDMVKTNNEKERQRLNTLLHWLWTIVIPQIERLETNDPTVAREKELTEKYAARAATMANTASLEQTTYFATCVVLDACYTFSHAYFAAASCDDGSYRKGLLKFWQEIDFIGVLERMTYLEEA